MSLILGNQTTIRLKIPKVKMEKIMKKNFLKQLTLKESIFLILEKSSHESS